MAGLSGNTPVPGYHTVAVVGAAHVARPEGTHLDRFTALGGKPDHPLPGGERLDALDSLVGQALVGDQMPHPALGPVDRPRSALDRVEDLLQFTRQVPIGGRRLVRSVAGAGWRDTDCFMAVRRLITKSLAGVAWERPMPGERRIGAQSPARWSRHCTGPAARGRT